MVYQENNPWYIYVNLSFFLLGTIGNVLIIVYFTKINTKKLKKTSSRHFLVILLAFTDLIVCIGAPLSYYYTRVFGLKANSFLCYFRGITMRIFPMFSIWVLVLMSYERHRSIVYPFEDKIKKRSFFIAYIFMLLLDSGIYVYPTLLVIPDKGFCRIVINTNFLLFFGFEFTFDCILPFVSMIYFYKQICKTINGSSAASGSSSSASESSSTATGVSLQNTDLSQQQLQQHRRNKTAMKTLKWLIIIYMLSIFPGRFMELLRMFRSYLNLQYSQMLIDFAFLIRLTNNMVNILVYVSMIKGFRKYLIKIILLRYKAE